MTNVMSSRFKNQFETSPENMMSNLKRVEVEKTMGFSPNTPGYQRPIYGAVENKLNLPTGLLQRIPGTTGKVLRLTDPRTNNSKWFGGEYPAISHVDASNMRGTFTIGDSFSPASDKVYNLTDGNLDEAADAIVRGFKERPLDMHYIEAQLMQNVEPFSDTSDLLKNLQKVDIPIGGDELFSLARAAAGVKPGAPMPASQYKKIAKSRALRELIKKRDDIVREALVESAVRGGNMPAPMSSGAKLPGTKQRFNQAIKSWDPFMADAAAEADYFKKLGK
jgi:hypothetical protein